MRLATLLTLVTGAAALKILQFDIQHNRRQASRSALPEPGTVDEPVGNLFATKSIYSVNLTIGTPPQSFLLDLDTGSTDLWVNTANSVYCLDGNCYGGTFDPSNSSTYNVEYAGAFNITYADNSNASGDYSTDVVQIGNITLTNQTFGVANVSIDNPAGLLGLSWPLDESFCGDLPVPTDCQPYSSVLESMVKQGYINSAAYSLWLDDVSASTGSILFGGIDRSKYSGDLVALPLIPNSGYSNDTNKVYTDFNAVVSNFTVTGLENFVTEDEASIVIFDSGTAFSYLPPAAFQFISDNLWNASMNSTSGEYNVDCSWRDEEITFNYTFGSTGGPVIAVNISEYVFPQEDDAVLDNGEPACSLGIQPNGDDSFIVGATFLRSAYVVYDMSNKEIAIAQANFDGGDPDILEIGQSIPAVSSTYTYTSIPAAATSAAATQTNPIGPMTATHSPTATSTSHKSAGMALRLESRHMLMGCVVTFFMVLIVL